MDWKKARYYVIFTILLLGVSFADPTDQLETALSQLCTAVNGLVPVAAMLMVLLASVIYATGQLMGAETRARANVWATSCLTGALIGLLIATVSKPILSEIYDGTMTSIHC